MELLLGLLPEVAIAFLPRLWMPQVLLWSVAAAFLLTLAYAFVLWRLASSAQRQYERAAQPARRYAPSMESTLRRLLDSPEQGDNKIEEMAQRKAPSRRAAAGVPQRPLRGPDAVSRSWTAWQTGVCRRLGAVRRAAGALSQCCVARVQKALGKGVPRRGAVPSRPTVSPKRTSTRREEQRFIPRLRCRLCTLLTAPVNLCARSQTEPICFVNRLWQRIRKSRSDTTSTTECPSSAPEPRLSTSVLKTSQPPPAPTPAWTRPCTLKTYDNTNITASSLDELFERKAFQSWFTRNRVRLHALAHLSQRQRVWSALTQFTICVWAITILPFNTFSFDAEGEGTRPQTLLESVATLIGSARGVGIRIPVDAQQAGLLLRAVVAGVAIFLLLSSCFVFVVLPDAKAVRYSAFLAVTSLLAAMLATLSAGLGTGFLLLFALTAFKALCIPW